MKYDNEIGFGLYMLFAFGGCVLIMLLYAHIASNYNKEDLKQIFWDNTPMGWAWKQLFGEKKKAKQAPMIFTSAPPPARPTSFKVGNNFHAPTYNTSSLSVPPVNNIGKPLTIQNWDRLTGLMVSVLGRRWLVTQAMHTSSGYECIFQTGGIVYSINVCIYGNMYDSHTVSVFCKGRIAHMDISVCKDPQLLLDKVAYEFADKFDV